jgi:hypothetical protein
MGNGFNGWMKYLDTMDMYPPNYRKNDNGLSDSDIADLIEKINVDNYDKISKRETTKKKEETVESRKLKKAINIMDEITRIIRE